MNSPPTRHNSYNKSTEADQDSIVSGGGGGGSKRGDNSLLISKVTGPLVSAEFYGNVSVLCWRFCLL